MNGRFFGRERELGRLEFLYTSRGFALAAVEGPAGSGRTALMREFCKGKKAIPFTAVEGGRERNLDALSVAVSKSLYKGLRSLVHFSSFADAAGFIAKLSENGRIVVVVDRCDVFPEDDDPIAETIRSGAFNRADVMLVLVGDPGGVSGRRYPSRPAVIEVGRLRFSEVVQAFPGLSGTEVMDLYAVTGGDPAMLSMFDPGTSVSEDIDRLLLSPDGGLYRDPLARTSIRSTGVYARILCALGDGMRRMGDIVEESGCGSPAACSTYLSSLIREGITERIVPYGESGSRRSMYRISDPVARFWYTFVEGNQSIIDYRSEPDLFKPLVSSGLEDYVRKAFRDVCLQFMQSNHAFFDMVPGITGMWWGSDGCRSMGRIDIVAESDDRSQTMFCDCRYRDSQVGMSVLDELIEKSTKVRSPGRKRYALFSKVGFTQELESYAEENDVTLVSLRDICWY